MRPVSARALPRGSLGLILLLILCLLQGRVPARGQTAGGSPPALAAPAGRALLIAGPAARRGLPFFSPNAIPCLYGEYLVGKELLPLYYTRAELVLSESWTALESRLWPSPGLRAYSLGLEKGSVLLLESGAYRLFLVLPGEVAPFRGFALALERRFSFFFSNAESDAELSFPASVDFSP